MNKIFTLFFSLLLANFLQAQDPITHLLYPAHGTVSTVLGIEDNTLDPGPAGNQTWDFSAVVFDQDEQVSSKLVNPVGTPAAASFPSANYAEESEEGASYAYYYFGPTETTFLGNYATTEQGTAVQVYSDPMTTMSLPMTYNQAPFTDNFSGSWETNDFPITATGSTSTEYDGYGTIITQLGTFTNVARLKLTTQQTQTIVIGMGFPNTTIETNSVTYSWVVPGSYTPVFSIMDVTITTTTFIGPTTETMKIGYLYPQGPLSNKNSFIPNLKISAGPNPAAEFIEVDFKDVESGEFQLTLINEMGMIVENKTVTASSGDKQRFQLEGMKSGMYIVKVSSSKGEAVKKFIKN